MSDARLREAERRWKETGNRQDGAAFYRARMRTGSLTEDQIYTAAFLGDEVAQAVHADGLYDQTGTMNDHVVGICPCGWCRWDEGPARWITQLLDWGQNLPFPGIDDTHAEQEMLIRMGRALAAAVWEHQGRLKGPAETAYVEADLRAARFLDKRDEESRLLCRILWQDNNWPAPEWAHQVLYYILSPSGWRSNMHHWFAESSMLIAPPCKDCGGRLNAEQIADITSLFGDDPLGEDLANIPINCQHCQGTEWTHLELGREVVSKALLPWVLSPPDHRRHG